MASVRIRQQGGVYNYPALSAVQVVNSDYTGSTGGSGSTGVSITGTAGEPTVAMNNWTNLNGGGNEAFSTLQILLEIPLQVHIQEVTLQIIRLLSWAITYYLKTSQLMKLQFHQFSIEQLEEIIKKVSSVKNDSVSFDKIKIIFERKNTSPKDPHESQNNTEEYCKEQLQKASLLFPHHETIKGYKEVI